MGSGLSHVGAGALTVPVRPVPFPFSLKIMQTNFVLRSFPRVGPLGVPALAHPAGQPRATPERDRVSGRGFRCAFDARYSTRFERSINDTEQEFRVGFWQSQFQGGTDL